MIIRQKEYQCGSKINYQICTMNEERRKQALEAFGKLLSIMDDLRARCPWDKKQTLESLRILTIEETYELSEAIMNKSMEDIKEELGDLLLHIAFYSKLGEEKKAFDVVDVLETINLKLIERHPHIYGDVIATTDKEVKDNWEKIKLDNGKKSTLSGVPEALPSVIKALRIQEKAAGVGFDWHNQKGVWDKIKEEIAEFEEVASKHPQNMDKLEDEFGDILFSLINLSRFLKINPDSSLEKTNRKFIERFNKMEESIKKSGKSFRDLTLEEMEEFWQNAK